jgi:tRNA:m4X modification enzyme
MSSWAVALPLDKLDEQEAIFHQQPPFGHLYRDLSPKQKSELGFKCKRILDTGRALWMEANGYKTSLIYYVDREVSPENCLMICTERKNA